MPNRARIAFAFSIGWIGLWSTVFMHVLVSSRGVPALSSPSTPLEDSKPGSEGFIRFAILGDCHSFRRPLARFRDAVESDGDYDFAVQLGDFVDYDESLAYHHYLSRVSPKSFKQTPLFLVRGNHEAIAFNLEPSDRFLELVPQADVGFVFRRTLFLILDSAHATITENTRAFAVDALKKFRAATPSGRVFVFTHIPPTISGTHCEDMSKGATEFLSRLCRDYAVDFLIAGHVHREHRASLGREGTTVIVDGSGGGSLPDPSPSVHYLEVIVPGKRDAEVIIRKHRLEREPLWQAKLDYMWHVTLLRHRWIVGLVAAAFMIRETLHLLGFSWISRTGIRGSISTMSPR